MHLTYVPEKLTEIHWLRYDNTVPLLDALKILIVKLVGNFIFFGILSACRSAIRPLH